MRVKAGGGPESGRKVIGVAGRCRLCLQRVPTYQDQAKQCIQSANGPEISQWISGSRYPLVLACRLPPMSALGSHT